MPFNKLPGDTDAARPHLNSKNTDQFYSVSLDCCISLRGPERSPSAGLGLTRVLGPESYSEPPTLLL